jgi:hypothetical protein
MKKHLLASLLLLSGLAASAQTTVSFGADAGYLIDSEEEFLTARLGFEYRGTETASHQLELEIGYTEAEPTITSEAELIPLTANYRFVSRGPNRLGWHAGAGLGVAWTRIDGVSIFGPVRLRDHSFAVQAFAGINYQVGPSTALTLGAKYIWVDEVKLAGTSIEVGDDVALSAGVTFRF